MSIDRKLYSRDPKLIGNDIYISEIEKDFAVNKGDLALITNVESIQTAIVRRINTAKLQYERYFKTVEGLIVVDSDYGNDAFNYLSSLNNSINREFVFEELQRIFNDESRIELQSIVFNETNVNKIDITITYLILSNNQLSKLVI